MSKSGKVVLTPVFSSAEEEKMFAEVAERQMGEMMDEGKHQKLELENDNEVE